MTEEERDLLQIERFNIIKSRSREDWHYHRLAEISLLIGPISYKTRKTGPLVKKRKVLQYTIKGQLVKEFDYLEELRMDGFCPEGARRAMKGDNFTHKGYRWAMGEEHMTRVS